MHLLLLATFTGSVDLELWKTHKTLGLLVLNTGINNMDLKEGKS